jgi:cytoskeletal protein CcmA (bactofilin family)
MNPFKRTGFDSIIGKGMVVLGDLLLQEGTTTVIDGTLAGQDIRVHNTTPDKVDVKTTLVVGGSVSIARGDLNSGGTIRVPNVTVAGVLECETLICEGRLALKAGAKIVAKQIQYRDIVIENGAIVLSQMMHLDHISAGEQT